MRIYVLPSKPFVYSSENFGEYFLLTFPTGCVTSEHTRRTEFTQLMSDHILGDKHPCKNLPVVNHEGIPDKLRNDCTGPSPCFDGLSKTGVLVFHYLLVKFLVDVWTFFRASGHCLPHLQH